MVKKSEGVVLGWVANALCQTVKPSEAVVATQLPTRHRTASVSILTRRCAQETGVAGVVGETTDRRGFGEMAISKPYRSPWVFDTHAKNFGQDFRFSFCEMGHCRCS